MLRDRMQSERNFGDRAERAEGPGHQLVQIVAGNILHHLAA